MRIASTLSVFVRFYIHCVFFLLSFVFFTLIAYGWTSIRSLMFTCRKECALCAYLHFAFGQRICFLPLAVSVCLYACALFFAVTVECSRLKLTPKNIVSCLSFVCLSACFCSVALHRLRAFQITRLRIIKCLFQIMWIFYVYNAYIPIAFQKASDVMHLYSLLCIY